MAIAKKLNIGLACVNEITAGLAYKKVCACWVPCQLMPKIKTTRLEAYQWLHSRYKSEGNDFLYSIVKKDNSWVHHNNLETKSQSLEYCHPSSPRKKKIQDSAFCWKMHAQSFLGLQMPHTQEVHGQRYKNQFQNLHEDPNEAGTTNCIQWGKKVMLLQHKDARPHTNTAKFSSMRQHQIWGCSTPSLQPGFGTTWLLVVQNSREISRRQSFHMWWRSSSCCGKMVSRTASKLLHQWVWKTCSALVALHQTRGRLHSSMRYTNKIHNRGYN